MNKKERNQRPVPIICAFLGGLFAGIFVTRASSFGCSVPSQDVKTVYQTANVGTVQKCAPVPCFDPEPEHCDCDGHGDLVVEHDPALCAECQECKPEPLYTPVSDREGSCDCPVADCPSVSSVCECPACSSGAAVENAARYEDVAATCNREDGCVVSGTPWMTSVVRNLILGYIKMKPDTVMLEYGSGGSTMYFSQYVKKLYSVEAAGPFAEQVKIALKKRDIKNVEYYYLPQECWKGICNEANVEYWNRYVQEVGKEKIHQDKQRILSHPLASYMKKADGIIPGDKFHGNMTASAAYLLKIQELPVKKWDVVFIDGSARASAPFAIYNYIDDETRVIIHDFYCCYQSRGEWEKRWNIQGLMEKYVVVAKVEDVMPYLSGSTAVVLQKKSKQAAESQSAKFVKKPKAKKWLTGGGA